MEVRALEEITIGEAWESSGIEILAQEANPGRFDSDMLSCTHDVAVTVADSCSAVQYRLLFSMI